ncbi:hypothetical protein JCM8097_008023 [Rhodosporidiobolus ruineniae]
MSSNKREGSPSAAAASGESTPAKRARIDDNSTKPASAAATSSAAAQGGALGGGETPSSPFNPKDTDSPSARNNGDGKRGGKNGKRGGKGGRGGRGGGRGGRDGGDRGQDTRSWGGRNTGKAEKEMRQWGKGAAKDGESAEGTPATEDDKKDRLPKKKVAVLIGYNGLGYKGSQHNPGMPTIEGEFFKAFVAAGAISEDNAVNPQKVSLARAARTDAGVHAAINVISLKMILEPASKEEGTTIEEHLNKFLPPTMRVWSVVRVQGSFDPRRLCDHRQYEYTLPTHVFLGPKPSSPMADMLEKQRAAASSSSSSTDAPAPPPSPIVAATQAFWAAQPADSKFSQDVAAKKGWRMPADVLEHAREFVKAYEGSHNFYNFTVGKDFRDRSCQRVMKNLTICDPFVVNDTEYVSVTFLGQSFMLHQIRKMIGLFVLAVRSATPSSLVPETFGPSRIHVPKAPGLGLLLVEPQYYEYNKRIVEANSKNAALLEAGKLSEKDVADQTRETIDPARMGIQEKIDAFKKEQVYEKMRAVEEEQLIFSKWLNYTDMFVGHDFEYLNPKGVIPAAATYKKGENPEKNRGAAPAAPSTEAKDGDSAAAAAAEGEKAPAKEGEDEVSPPSDDEGDVAGEEEG